MKMTGRQIVMGLLSLTFSLGSAMAAQPKAVYDPSHDPDQNMSPPQIPKDIKSSFDSKGSDCSGEFNVVDAYLTHFGKSKTSTRTNAAIFLITVKNDAYSKNIYVQPVNQGSLHTKSLAQPFKGAYDSAMTSFVYTNATKNGLDTFTILDDRVRKNGSLVYDLSVEMGGRTFTCSNVTITRR